MDDNLAIPKTSQTAVNIRLHYYHRGKTNMYEAAKDIWYTYIYRSLASIAGNCRECTLVERFWKNICPKGDEGKLSEPKEPVESVQLDFWWIINYIIESKKYVLMAVDHFSWCPSTQIGQIESWSSYEHTSMRMVFRGKSERTCRGISEWTKEQISCPRT